FDAKIGIFQSNHTGIETQVAQTFRVEAGSTNRTIVELKPAAGRTFEEQLYPSNRTILELKHSFKKKKLSWANLPIEASWN
ncbi:MAG TPA: hypothetical protein PKV50_06240, partial [Prolixibacteraceae bacterium]|nr:hypothetical protein [Prolixibacteraceae bacterium]